MQEKCYFHKDQQFYKGGEIMYEKLNKYSGEIAGKVFFNLIVLTIFIISGCAMKFPVPDETNQTILIIPVETRQTLGHFVFTLDVSIKGSSGNEGINHTVEPNPKMLFSYNTQLKPGKYKITKMIRKAKPGFKLGGKPRPEKMKDNVEFELEKGKITIIDKMILFQQPDPGKKREKKDMRNMDENQRAQERRKEKAERKAEQEAMKKHSAHHTNKHMKEMKKNMLAGKTFSQSHKIAMKKVGA